MSPADFQAMFARVRANAERVSLEVGDLYELLTTVSLAERAVIGDGDVPGPGWLDTTLRATGVHLPLAVGTDGDIADATGDAVIQIDPNRERRDEKVAKIAALIALAVNTCGGHASREAQI